MRVSRWVAAVTASALLAIAPAASTATSDAQEIIEPELVLYQPPISTFVVDPFRPPAHIGAAGNRGLQYGSSENHAARASANGTVAFAGQVGFRKVVTIEHADGIRTTYTGLRDVWVGRGDHVVGGQVVGVAIARFHFGARIGEHYLDPQILLDASQPTNRARLLPPPAGAG